MQLGDYYLLHKRPNTGLLRSMWEFPSAEASDFSVGESQLKDLLGALGFELKLDSTMVRELTHVFSHRKWEMKAYRGTLSWRGSDAEQIAAIQTKLPADYMLLPRLEFATYTWAGPHGKLTELCK